MRDAFLAFMIFSVLPRRLLMGIPAGTISTQSGVAFVGMKTLTLGGGLSKESERFFYRLTNPG